MSVFSVESFRDPDAEFRPLQIVHGFNHSLSDPKKLSGVEGIDHRLDTLRRLGVGGVVSNVGGGFGEYLQSERQWEVWIEGMRRADERGLVLWWYDEKGYPSGTAGGVVTRADPSLAALGLACYTHTVTGPSRLRLDLPASCLSFEVAFASRNFVTGSRDEVIDLTGRAKGSGEIEWDVPSGEWTILYLAQRYMYEGTHSAANVSEFKYYVNLLEPRATERFLRVTHTEYYKHTPTELWRKIRAVFTDEPSLMVGYAGPLPERYQGNVPVIDAPLFTDRPVAVPWSSGFTDEFRERKGYDPKPSLWCLFCGQQDDARVMRHDYYEVVTEVYTDACYRQIRQWCDEHGIAYSGHLMAEESIHSHVSYHGSLFAPIRQMNLPGIDMLDSDPSSMLEGLGFMTAKQVSSVAHLTGGKQVHSECSDWVQRNSGHGATLAQRRGQGNILYVLGVNQVTSYWQWNDIGEDAYRRYNDYMGRLGSLLRGGIHRCDVAVLYPIRTAWLDFLPHAPKGYPAPPRSNAHDRVDVLNREYSGIVRDLLRSQIDLDIIDEQAVCEATVDDRRMYIADESYRVIVLPGCEALSAETANKLEEFGRAGGIVVSIDKPPCLCASTSANDQVAAAMHRLFGDGEQGIELQRENLVEYLRDAGCATIELSEPNTQILCTQRELEGRGLCFVVNASAEPQRVQPRTRLNSPVDLYRPVEGSISPYESHTPLSLDAYEGVFIVERR